MGFLSKLFGTKKQTGLPGLLELNTQSVSLSVALPEIFCEHFNTIAPEMLGKFSDAESLQAISDFALVITKIKILNSICTTRSESIQNDIEKVAGMSAACATSQIQVIDSYMTSLTNNIQTSKIQAYVNSQIDDCNSTINTILSETRILGLKSYVFYNVDSFLKVLEEQKTKDYLTSRIHLIIENQSI